MAVNQIPLYIPGGNIAEAQADDIKEFEARRRAAREALARALQPRQIQHWTQGAAQVAESALAGYDEYRARKDREDAIKQAAEIMAGIMPKPAGAQPAKPATPPSAASPAPPPAPTYDPKAADPVPPPMAPPLAGPTEATIPLLEGMDSVATPPPPPAPPMTFGASDMGGYTPEQTAIPTPSGTSFGPRQMAQSMADRWAMEDIQPSANENPPANKIASLPAAPSVQAGPQRRLGPAQIARAVMGRMGPEPAGLATDMGGYGPQLPMPTPAERPAPPVDLTGGAPAMPEPPVPREELQFRAMTAGMARPAPQPETQGSMVLPPLSMPTTAPTPQVGPQAKGMMGLGASPSAFQFTADYSAGRTGPRLDRKAIDTVVAHDTSGVNGRLSDPQNLSQYHYLFDDKGIYKLRDSQYQAPHATSYNPRSIAMAYRGLEGQPLPPEAVANGRKLAEYIQSTYGVKPEQFKSHPSLGSAGTRSGGKDPREASWLPEVLKRGTQMAAAQPAQAAPAAEARTPIPSNPQATGLIQMAQSGQGLTPEQFRAMMLNPYTRGMATQMLMKEMERARPPTEDELLKRRGAEADIRYKDAQIKALEAKPNAAADKMLERYKMGQAMGLKGDDLTRYALTEKLPDQFDNPAKTSAGIAGGLDALAKIPREVGSRTMDSSIGPLRGQDSGIIPSIAKVWGSITNAAGERSTTETRSRIAADSEALAAQIKPLIRKPGEGAWSDADQARLNSIVGSLATSRDTNEYYRNLEGVRQRLMSNFQINLPPITKPEVGERPPKAGPAPALPPGYSIRRLN